MIDFFICNCRGINHQLVLETIDDEDKEIYGSFHLVSPFFITRISNALRYIFNKEKKGGDFDSILLNRADTDKFLPFVSYLQGNQEVPTKSDSAWIFYSEDIEYQWTVKIDCNQEYWELDYSCITPRLKKRKFFGRVIMGVRYIFGHKCRYGCFDSFVWNQTNYSDFAKQVSVMKNTVAPLSFITHEQMLDNVLGEKGTPLRDKFEKKRHKF